VLTVIGFLLAVVAAGMALPAALSLGLNDHVASLEQALPPGWRSNLWIAAFVVGTTSMTIGINRYQGAARTYDRCGRRWANLLTVIAGIGAVIWMLPLIVYADGQM
jgi:uncharacterized membrane protein YidH (DUF202 family)